MLRPVLLLLLASSLAASPYCGQPFLERAAELLRESQHPAQPCSQRRLLVLETEPEHFEGLGSVLIGVAEALAEAQAAGRTLVLGPPEALPAIFRLANSGWDSFFMPVGACSWAKHVSLLERAGLAEEARAARPPCSPVALTPLPRLQMDSCRARVKVRRHRSRSRAVPCSRARRLQMSTPTRGGPMLYSPPEEVRLWARQGCGCPRLAHASMQLVSLLPEGADSARAGECWAAAVFGAAVQLRPAVEARLLAVQARLFNGSAYAGAHLREGDNGLYAEQYSGRVYTNKPVVSAGDIGAALASLQAGGESSAPLLPVYLATDAADAEAKGGELGRVLGRHRDAAAPAVRVLPRFRTPHGSHNVAYATAFLQRSAHGASRLLLPYETLSTYTSPGGRYAGASAAEQAGADREQVRWEALEDLFLLSGAQVLVGASSSHYSVSALLWGLWKGSCVGHAWVDVAEVSSGRLSTGFLHGQLNTTFALHHPEMRTVAATRRWLDWPLGEAPAGLEEADAGIAFHPQRSLPIVPPATARLLRANWMCTDKSAGADGYVRRCAAHVRRGRRRTGRERCASVIELVNQGADFLGDFNVELAAACWRAASALRGDTAERTAEGEHPSDIAEENLGVMLRKRRAQLGAYMADVGAE